MKRLIAFAALLLLAGDAFAIMAPMPADPADTEIGNSSDSSNSTDSGCNIQ